MTVHYRVGDVREVMATIPDGRVSLARVQPALLNKLRSYLQVNTNPKYAEIGSVRRTLAEFLDTLLELHRRVGGPVGVVGVPGDRTGRLRTPAVAGRWRLRAPLWMSGAVAEEPLYYGTAKFDQRPGAACARRCSGIADSCTASSQPGGEGPPAPEVSLFRSLSSLPSSLAYDIDPPTWQPSPVVKRPGSERDLLAPTEPGRRRARRQGAPVHVVHHRGDTLTETVVRPRRGAR